MPALTPQAHGVPSPLCPDAGGARTTLPQLQTHTAPYSQGFPQETVSPGQFLTRYYWRIRPVRYFNPYQRCCDSLGTGSLCPVLRQRAAAGNYQVTISKS